MHYKDKLVGNQIRTFVYATGYLYFGYGLNNLGNLSAAFFFAHNSGTYATHPNIITKKGEPLRTLLICITDITMPYFHLLPLYLSHYFQFPALFFGSNFVNFFLSADYLLIKLISEKAIKKVEDCKYHTSIQNLPNAFFNFFDAAQTAKFLLDNHTIQIIGYFICLPNETNNVNIMH